MFLGLPQLAGVAGGALGLPALFGWYQSLAHPPGTPPTWVIGPAWGVLYLLVGAAAWLVWAGPREARPALLAWGWQLLFNALWVPAFFGLRNPEAGLFVICVLIVGVAITITMFWRARPVAALLLLPYFAWVCYAAWLNYGFVRLNPLV